MRHILSLRWPRLAGCLGKAGFITFIVSMGVGGILLSPAAAFGGDAGRSAWSFFEDGRLYRVELAGEQWVDVKNGRSGFTMIHFAADGVVEIPLNKVEWVNGKLRVRGERDFPRLVFDVEQGERHFTLSLVRWEGVPKGRDVSLKLRMATTRPVAAWGGNDDGEGLFLRPGLKIQATKEVITAYWTFLGDLKPGERPAPLYLGYSEGL